MRRSWLRSNTVAFVVVTYRPSGIVFFSRSGHISVMNSPGFGLDQYLHLVMARVGKTVPGWKVGDRVVIFPSYRCGRCWACQHGLYSSCPESTAKGIGSGPGWEAAGGFTKLVRIIRPDYRLYPLPDEVSFEEGTLVEPLACSLHAVRKSMFKPREKTAVLGCGTMGLGVIAHLKHAGAGLIIATENRDT